MKMKKIENHGSLYICGDIHGEWKTLGNNCRNLDGVIVIAGDCGIWEEKKPYWDQVSRWLLKRSPKAVYLCVRGNHDNPQAWETGLDYPNLKTIKDGEPVEVGNICILPIGGGTSVDRESRVKENKKLMHFGAHRRVWWEDEGVNQDLDLPEVKPDIIVSHEAPIGIGPTLVREDGEDLDIYSSIVADREYLQTVLIRYNPRFWFFGHYHSGDSGNTGFTSWYQLGIHMLHKVEIDDESSKMGN